jgi:hypothetical protein
MICFEDKEIRHPQSTCFSSCLCFFMGPAWKLTWQSPAQVKQQDLYISPARNQFYIVIKPDLGLIWLMNQVPSYIQGYIVIKEKFWVRRKNTFEKKNRSLPSRPGKSTKFDRFFALAGLSPYLNRSSHQVGLGLITILCSWLYLELSPYIKIANNYIKFYK